jgi:hypothetical protein
MMSPFHEGELEVQSLAGESQMAERNGVLIADRIIGGARPFLHQQSMAVFGSWDWDKNLWSSIVFGHLGFMRSEDGYAVDFELSQVVCRGKILFGPTSKSILRQGCLRSILPPAVEFGSTVY